MFLQRRSDKERPLYSAHPKPVSLDSARQWRYTFVFGGRRRRRLRVTWCRAKYLEPCHCRSFCAAGVLAANTVYDDGARTRLVCLESKPQSIALLLIDELGSFYKSEFGADRENSTLRALDQFISSVIYRQNALSPGAGAEPSRKLLGADFYRVEGRGRTTNLRLSRIDMSRLGSAGQFTSIQAIAEYVGDGNTMFSIFCGRNEYSQLTLGDRFFEQVARHILSIRKQHDTYYFHITDLDLSALVVDNEMPLQTSHYFRYKTRLETAINKALQAFS